MEPQWNPWQGLICSLIALREAAHFLSSYVSPLLQPHLHFSLPSLSLLWIFILTDLILQQHWVGLFCSVKHLPRFNHSEGPHPSVSVRPPPPACGLLFPPPGDLANPGMETHMSYVSCTGGRVLFHQHHLRRLFVHSTQGPDSSVPFVPLPADYPLPKPSDTHWH